MEIQHSLKQWLILITDCRFHTAGASNSPCNYQLNIFCKSVRYTTIIDCKQSAQTTKEMHRMSTDAIMTAEQAIDAIDEAFEKHVHTEELWVLFADDDTTYIQAVMHGFETPETIITELEQYFELSKIKRN